MPRNCSNAANADPPFFDGGLAGPLRQDLDGTADYCGRFKTPSLRNVATRRVFFHNGVFTQLDEAARFCSERDVHPTRYYGRDASGQPRPADDLPAACQDAIHRETPFGAPDGDRPVLSQAEVRDIVSFLESLKDDGQAPPLTTRLQPRSGRIAPPLGEHVSQPVDPFNGPTPSHLLVAAG